MTATRIGLMGFGRIGRNLFRILYRRDDLRIVAISDTADPDALEYLLRFDTLLGRFPDEVSVRDGHLYAWGRQVKLLAGEKPGDVPWGDLGVDVVVEATSRVRGRRELEKHLEQGASRVLLCSPAADPPDLTVVVGINDDQLRPEHRIVSNSSCTAHAAAPVLRILDEAFGIERAFLTSVHAYTNQQRLADVPTADLRTGRAAAENIIPQHTNAPQILEHLLPTLRGKIRGMAMNVPVPNGSVVDLVCWHRQPVTKTAINEVVRTAASGRFPGVLAYENAPLVSSDIIRSSHSGTFDGDATMTLGERVSKTLCWFDNGWGYAHRAVDLIERFTRLGEEAAA
ncbi:MAG TPA: glyceraldehyde 3-phosphate dehydrogenase NAD-binding domain-containing protein [Thermoanaerobaculia bacterium]|nr:glyceraldehyde 3-phosphate dehydrogenase NAD-binding domain-containing protein [Thermoanaerobaculia bacterium]